MAPGGNEGKEEVFVAPRAEAVPAQASCKIQIGKTCCRLSNCLFTCKSMDVMKNWLRVCILLAMGNFSDLCFKLGF